MGDVADRPHAWRADGATTVVATHPRAGTYHLYTDDPDDVLLHRERDQHATPLRPPVAPVYVKDSFHRALVDGDTDAVNPQRSGTKAAAVHRLLGARQEPHERSGFA